MPVRGARLGVDPDLGPQVRQSHARWVLVLVGVAFLITQFVLLPMDRPPQWDEAVYLSQVTPGMEGTYFNPWHARGITLIVAPATWLGASVVQVRLFLAVLSSVATVAAFGVWIPMVGLAAAIAAFVTSFSWLSLFAASEVMPNYWSALLAVTTTGLVARRLDGGGTRHLVGASVAMAGMALVRPTEATLLAGAIALSVMWKRRNAWRDVIPLGIGLLLGWLPWLIEMSVRFGGMGEAVRRAGEGQHFGGVVSVGENVRQHVAWTAGKLSRSVVGGMIWWGVVIAAGILGFILPRKVRTASLLCGVGALVLAVANLIFVPALTPRFLLPTYALASLSAAIGLVALLQRGHLARLLGATVLVLLLPWAVWQGVVAARQVPARTLASELPSRVGTRIRELADGRPCFFLAPHAYPQIALASRCQGHVRRGVPTEAYVEEIRRRREIFVILLRRAPGDSLLGPLPPVRVPGYERDWYIYHLPAPA